MIKFEIVDAPHIQYDQTQFKLPVRATQHSAGYDFYSPIDITIQPKSAAMIWTNIKAKFDRNIVLILSVTSGMGKKGVMLSNTIGVIDSDYYGNINNDGNIGIRLYNYSDTPYTIHIGDKIGQGIFLPFLTVTDEDTITNIRTGGFGSTDK
ncbi:MAG: dUTP diphosphatase [Clostridia bacterium]|nr:dUTP diphosphatase [Clostridia bacterium]